MHNHADWQPSSFTCIYCCCWALLMMMMMLLPNLLLSHAEQTRA
jgi:hypothetical protein